MNEIPRSHAEQGLGPLRDLLTSDEVNEIVINPDGGVWVDDLVQLWLADFLLLQY